MADNALKLLHTKWKTAFATFVETGEASQELLNSLDSNPDLLTAVDDIVEQQVDEMRGVIMQLLSVGASTRY